jgi:hypothetical protein
MTGNTGKEFLVLHPCFQSVLIYFHLSVCPDYLVEDLVGISFCVEMVVKDRCIRSESSL